MQPPRPARSQAHVWPFCLSPRHLQHFNTMLPPVGCNSARCVPAIRKLPSPLLPSQIAECHAVAHQSPGRTPLAPSSPSCCVQPRCPIAYIAFRGLSCSPSAFGCICDHEAEQVPKRRRSSVPPSHVPT
ncbi:hypothetical protein BKA80DRAFT_259923 [Phyllosticta citrichinensis]